MKNKFIKYASLTVMACMSLLLNVHATEINYAVTMPKEINLNEDKQADYSIGVAGEIPEYKILNIVPVNSKYEEQYNFYMHDLAEIPKEDVLATIKQSKTDWSSSDVASSYTETNNSVTAKNLSAGNWKGVFHVKISLLLNPNHEHVYTSSITKEPTCTEEGETTYTCECGDSYTEPIPKIPHDYTETITKEPTCTEEGEKTYTCDECGDTYTEKIPPTGIHIYTESITKEPTCTENGTKTYTCECGESYTEDIPATGHNYVSEITKEATCTEDGVITYTCTKCGDTYTETIPAHGHEFEEGECIHCGEKDPDYHDWIAIERELHAYSVNSSGVKGSAYKMGSMVSASASSVGSVTRSYALIEVPEVLTETVPYLITYDYRLSCDGGYNNFVNTFCYEGFNTGAIVWSGFSYSTHNSNSGGPYEVIVNLHPGTNYFCSLAQRQSKNSGSAYMRIILKGELKLPRELLNYHYCSICKEKEDHYTSCIDETKDEYYFCEECGQQFRHRCKYDDADISFANCEGGDAELTCVGDYYDETNDLFEACGETRVLHFNGLGHNFQPWVVQVEPVVTINPNSSESKYTFTKSSGSTYDTYRGSIAMANGDIGVSGSSTSMNLEITLPDNFNGTYSLPILYSISSSAFTTIGYRMRVYAPGLSYDLDYSSTSTGTTSGTVYVTLKAGVNKLSFSLGAQTNLSSWKTGTNGGPSGSATFRVPHMPFYIFNGKEVHKCSRCNLEVSHENEFRVTERIEANCIEEGYVNYICDTCEFTYTEILPIDPDNHKNGDEDDDGYCDDCGKQIRHIHNYTRTVTTQPTCTENGVAIYTCNGDSFDEECSYSYSETLAALGHNYQPYIIENCVGIGTKWIGSTFSYNIDKDSDANNIIINATNTTTTKSQNGTYHYFVVSVNLPEDYEGTYYYRVSYSLTHVNHGASNLIFCLNDYEVDDIWLNIDNRSTDKSGSTGYTCKPGHNEFLIGFTTWYENGTGYTSTASVELKLPKLKLDYSEQYHRCIRCYQKEEHYDNNEDGACDICNHSNVTSISSTFDIDEDTNNTTDSEKTSNVENIFEDIEESSEDEESNTNEEDKEVDSSKEHEDILNPEKETLPEDKQNNLITFSEISSTMKYNNKVMKLLCK